MYYLTIFLSFFNVFFLVNISSSFLKCHAMSGHFPEHSSFVQNNFTLLRPLSSKSSAQNTRQRSVILVYPLETCAETLTQSSDLFSIKDNVTVSVDSKPTKLKMWKTLRNFAFSTLEKRVVDMMRTLKVPLSYTVPSSIALTSPPIPFSFNVLLSSLNLISPRLSSVYLDVLQMEITQIPAFLTSDDIVQLAKEIPCILSVQEDAIIRRSNLLQHRHTSETRPYQKLKDSENFDTTVPLTDEIDHPDVFKDAVCMFDSLPEYTERLRDIPANITKAESREFHSFNDTTSTSPSKKLRASAKRSINTSDEHLGSGTDKVEYIDDPFLSLQWYLKASHRHSTNLDLLWKFWKGSPEMVVAVIDNGCQMNHPDLYENLWINTEEICGDGIDNDHNGYIDDCYGWDWVDNDNNPEPMSLRGHGTGAAGIIAATMNNGLGIAGVCPFCKIMCLRFISPNGGFISDEIAAFHYAVRKGAKISNNSFGSYGTSFVEYEALKRLSLLGHIFVTSAGNNNCNTDTVIEKHTPSGYELDSIISVGASSRTGEKAAFSNYGKNSVHLFAPGESLVTTSTGVEYAYVDGTSFAAPIVSGVVALLWSLFPELSAKDIRNSLLQTCNYKESLDGYSKCNGVVDAYAAVLRCKEIYVDRLVDEYIMEQTFELADRPYRLKNSRFFKNSHEKPLRFLAWKSITEEKSLCKSFFLKWIGFCSPTRHIEDYVAKRIREKKNITLSEKSLQSLVQRVSMDREKLFASSAPNSHIGGFTK